MKNPQAFQQFEELKRSNNDPQEFLNKLMGNYTPEQRQQFMKFAQNFGIKEEQLNEYGINFK